MATPFCLRCLRSSLQRLDPSPAPSQRALFSTSASLFADPPKRKPPVGKAPPRVGKTLRLSKNKRVSTGRPPAPGERKALRKRVVLSNTNALEVPGLQNLTKAFVTYGMLEELQGRELKLEELQGQVLGFEDSTVDTLRALEAFKPTQGWNLFQRPSSLVRAETIELAKELQNLGDGSVHRRVLFGERRSGKSVLMLQGLAMAHMKGHLVLYFPEAHEMTIGHTTYQPVITPEGTAYIQPEYTARLLGNFLRANREVLERLRLRRQHELPIPIQPNISLARFVELGTTDPDLAWPIWQALYLEIFTGPIKSSSDKGLQRPPVFVALDGFNHIMRASAYLDADLKPVHAHDLTLVRDFTSLLTSRPVRPDLSRPALPDGDVLLPSGGIVLAAVSGTNSVSTPMLSYLLEENHTRRSINELSRILNNVRRALTQGVILNVEAYALHDSLLPSRHPLSNLYNATEIELTRMVEESGGEDMEEPQYKPNHHRTIDRLFRELEQLTPKWDPFMVQDTKVADVMKDVEVQKVEGLSKEEAKGLMEYYARSGVLRSAVTDGLVSERWTLSGNGIIGELEKNNLRVRL